MNTYILLLIGAVTLLEGVSTASREIDDRLNFIEPTSDNWLLPNNIKPKGKLGKVFQASYKEQNMINEKKKITQQSERSRQEETNYNDRLSPLMNTDSEKTTENLGGVAPIEYTMPKGLHDHESKKKYDHSIMDGWIL